MAYTTINKPTDYFNTVLYTGNGSNGNAITGVGFQPDLVWGKTRSGATDHYWVDAVRGATKVLRSNFNGTEYTQSDSLVSFDTDGFTLDDDNDGGVAGNFNVNAVTYVAWNWLAGGTASSNTDGSITSSVSANTTAGFSIVSYTGNNVDGATVGHGLGTTPAMTIIKNRSTSGTNWITKHQNLPSGNNVLFLDGTNATLTNNGGHQSHGSTTVTMNIGTSHLIGINDTGDNYVMYCFAEKKGYSKFGSYVGNGSTDGAFVYTGFKPAFVIEKRTDTTGNWLIWDNTRNTFNEVNNYLNTNTSNTELTDGGIDIVSNGFKARKTGTDLNASGGSYIYMAFAESPFTTSTGIPTTAR